MHGEAARGSSYEAEVANALRGGELGEATERVRAEPFSRTPAPGVEFSREQLELLASGPPSQVLGWRFIELDRMPHPVRLPRPPLLMLDRVTAIAGEPRSLERGTIWIETDVRWDSSFLHDGSIPMSLMADCDQAVRLLVSWLGIDFRTGGERVLRLLGCDLRWHGARMPRPTDVLRYEVRITSRLKLGEIDFFFFEYDCRIDGELVLTLRSGQAGLFSHQELREATGITWQPAAVSAERGVSHRFGPAELRAFSEGDLFACFGAGYELAQTHQRSPRIPSGRMLLIDEVLECDPQAGPFRRGYVRARRQISPCDWFFAAQPDGDRYMPGALICESTLQAMSVFMGALGLCVDKDGWRFAPLQDQTYSLRCRGQVTPDARELICEVFVREVDGGRIPGIVADVLGTCDGKAIFHGTGIGLQLLPDTPLTSRPDLIEASSRARRPSAESNGVVFDDPRILAAAIGAFEYAFAERALAPIDASGERSPRLPAPPYQFLTRVTGLGATKRELKKGAWIEAEYDIESDAWFMVHSGNGRVPLCALLEAAMQPCGWLAAYITSHPSMESWAKPGTGFCFRNLGGKVQLHAEVSADGERVRTTAKLKEASSLQGMLLVSFDIQSFAGDRLVLSAESQFGFFPIDMILGSAGLDIPSGARGFWTEPSNYRCDLTRRPAKYFDRSARLDGPMLSMLDGVDGFWPTGGACSLGKLRAVKRVDPTNWYFRAHFWRDPVQPGALGFEAMVQTLKFWMIETGMTDGVENARFRALTSGQPLSWKCRGQVDVTTERIAVELDIVATGRDDAGPFAVAEAWLWADSRRVYHVQNLGLQVCADRATPCAGWTRSERVDLLTDAICLPFLGSRTEGLPSMLLAEHMSGVAAHLAEQSHPTLGGQPWHMVRIDDLHIESRPGADVLRVDACVTSATASRMEIDGLSIAVEARGPSGGAPGVTAECVVRFARGYPAAGPHACPALPTPNTAPIDTGDCRFQLLEVVAGQGRNLSCTALTGALAVPPDRIGVLGLQAGVQAALRAWAGDGGSDGGLRLRRAHFYGPTPAFAPLRCEVRGPTSSAGDRETAGVTFLVQLISGDGKVWAELQLTTQAPVAS
jgi:3-hydroxymyristoyl/3-hydroxydecanoyl-(acyl carrier protein) dehydratase